MSHGFRGPRRTSIIRCRIRGTPPPQQERINRRSETRHDIQRRQFFCGDGTHFGGPIHGLVMLIAVVVVMLVAEEAIVRLVRRLA